MYLHLPCAGVSCGSNAYCSGGSCYCNSGYTGNANSGCTKVETCTYTTTASNCSSQCKNVGSSSCTKNGTTYYNGCGSSKCSSGQTCQNGTCVTSCVSGGSRSCTGPTDCGYKGSYSSCKDCDGVTHYSCYECRGASDCPHDVPCIDGFCRCRSGDYLNAGGLCCPADVPLGTYDPRCYYY